MPLPTKWDKKYLMFIKNKTKIVIVLTREIITTNCPIHSNFTILLSPTNQPTKRKKRNENWMYAVDVCYNKYVYNIIVCFRKLSSADFAFCVVKIQSIGGWSVGNWFSPGDWRSVSRVCTYSNSAYTIFNFFSLSLSHQQCRQPKLNFEMPSERSGWNCSNRTLPWQQQFQSHHLLFRDNLQHPRLHSTMCFKNLFTSIKFKPFLKLSMVANCTIWFCHKWDLKIQCEAKASLWLQIPTFPLPYWKTTANTAMSFSVISFFFFYKIKFNFIT